MKAISTMITLLGWATGLIYGWLLLTHVNATPGLWGFWILSMLITFISAINVIKTLDETYKEMFEKAMTKIKEEYRRESQTT
jgi:F0F1-type ATP synthase assembly protein I